MNDLLRRAASGTVAGLAASGPMTLAMEAMHRVLPRSQQQALPPRKITMRAMHKMGIGVPGDESSRLAATLASHFGYGAGMGALYGLAAPEIPAPPAAKGIGYGLLVWTGSYLGLLPALRLMSPATRHPARRNLLMIAAHVVWGGVLGIVTDRLQQAQSRPVSMRSLPRSQRQLQSANEGMSHEP